MAKIYLSYRTTDREVAREIASRLQSIGHTVTVDTDILVPGQEWRTVLRNALEDADCVIAIISVNSISSPFVLTEVGAVRALRKPLIPIMLGPIDVPSVLSDLHCVRLLDNNLEDILPQIDSAVKRLANRNVFIVHGHDEARKWELKNFLMGLGLNAVVLHEQDSLGKTIIEKFEHYAAQSNFAFVLMTPDDISPVSDSTEAKWRARQNVIMELGWFMARLGRHRVVILYKGDIEIPSDILGVIYLKFNENILEVGESIRQSLKGAGMIA